MPDRFVELVKSDFLALGYQFGVVNVLKAMINVSFICVFIVRCATHSPTFLYPFLRAGLVMLFSVDVGNRSKIGKGLVFPHPVGIVIGNGVVLGDRATIYQGVTLGGKRSFYPVFGSGCIVYCNAVVVGACKIADEVIIGASVFLDSDVCEIGKVIK